VNELVRDAVVVAIQLDVVIDIDFGASPFGKEETVSRERFQGGFV